MTMTLTELETKIGEFNAEAGALSVKRDLLAAHAADAGLSKRAIAQKLASVKVNMPKSQ